METTHVWQYIRRDFGLPFGSPREMTATQAARAIDRLGHFLVAYNTETGEVEW